MTACHPNCEKHGKSPCEGVDCNGRDQEERLSYLKALYDELPQVACKGLCWNSCGPIDMSDAERERITELGIDIPVFTEERSQRWAANERLYCPALSFKAGGGRVGCTVYAARPLICRVWGVGEDDLACPHGCEMTGQRLSHVDVHRLIGQSFQVGGHGEDDVTDGLEVMEELMADPEHAALVDRLMKGDHSVVPQIQMAIQNWRNENGRP